MLFKKTISEGMKLKDKELTSKKIYSGGEDIIKRILTSIWEETTGVSTTWEVEKDIEGE